jgi:hypothetical protein
MGKTGLVKRERAVQLAEHILRNLGACQEQWPLSLVRQLCVFGSFARGALDPHDLDIDVEYDQTDHQWGMHVAQSLAYGRDPHASMRRALLVSKRGCQMLFNFRERADFELIMLWERGESLAVALARMHAIEPDHTAGRAPRDSMLPQFKGIDEWVPRPCREALLGAVNSGAIALDRVQLDDAAVASTVAAQHIDGRWKPSSPLHRAAGAAVAHWEQRGIDPGQAHLHGADVRDRETPYFAGFGWRYFGSIPTCLTEYGGVEWIEVVRPTRTQPLYALRIIPLDKSLLRQAWS